MKTKIITGVGSRETPQKYLDILWNIGLYFAEKGYILRSGGANGADSTFEAVYDSVKGEKEIYLPWKGFNKNPSPLHHISGDALKMAAENHPYWANLSPAAEKLMARNCYQVLGEKLNKASSLLVCYTEYEEIGQGGTCFTLTLARKNKVPCYNIFKQEELDLLRRQVKDGLL